MISDFQPLAFRAGELVFNWHVTEACNYRCRYCYAKWQDADTGRELIHDRAGTRRLLEQIWLHFGPNSSTVPLRTGLACHSLRLNLAGGEPLLYGEKVVETLAVARGMGFATSVISNGSRLDSTLVTDLSPHLSMLGLSLDSVDECTNLRIGRADRRSRVLDINALEKAIALARRVNPGLKLKVNTVVNALNASEDMSALIHRLKPTKWKVLRMLPTVTDEIAVTDDEFLTFVHRHMGLGDVMCVEDNTDMSDSYIMIDPHGRFFQNSAGQKGYKYSRPILDVGAGAAFTQIAWSPLKFAARYGSRSLRRAA